MSTPNQITPTAANAIQFVNQEKFAIKQNVHSLAKAISPTVRGIVSIHSPVGLTVVAVVKRVHQDRFVRQVRANFPANRDLQIVLEIASISMWIAEIAENVPSLADRGLFAKKALVS